MEEGDVMRHSNDKETAWQSTPQVNNAIEIESNSLLQKKMIFNDAVVIPPHSLFRILSHSISLDSTLNGSNITGWWCTSNHTLKICLVNLSIEKNDNNEIEVSKAVNTLMKVIHGIEGDSNKVKIAPWKNKQPYLDVLKYIKGWKCPNAEVGK